MVDYGTHGRLNDVAYSYKTRSTRMSSTSCVVSLKNGDECDSFHGIAAIREMDRLVASLKERVRARAGEREREGEEVRVWCTQS